jgi:hypothetical protein
VHFSFLGNDRDLVEEPGGCIAIGQMYGSSSSSLLTTPNFHQEIWVCDSRDVSGSEPVYDTGQDETKHKRVCSSSSGI